jgi:hypothetical protein
MERNLVLFLNHGEQHVIDKIKEEHPEWVSEDGVCQPCAEYYRKQLSGELTNANIGPSGRRRRYVMGTALLLLTAVLIPVILTAGLGRPWRLILFLPAFLGMLCVIQAREKTCAVLAEFGMRDMDSGQCRIDNTALAQGLKSRGRAILIKSALLAALLAVLFFMV